VEGGEWGGGGIIYKISIESVEEKKRILMLFGGECDLGQRGWGGIKLCRREKHTDIIKRQKEK